MNLQEILNSIKVGKIIKKPRKETEIISIDENRFYYRIRVSNKKSNI